jgi:hypothetical protein
MTDAHRTNPLRRLGLAGGALLLSGIFAPASAQFFARPFFGGFYGPVVVPAPVPRAPIGIGAMAVLGELEDRGFRDLTIVARRPDVFVIDAVDPRRQAVRLIVDAYDGEILERFARERDTAARAPDARRDAPRAIRPEGARPDDRAAEKSPEKSPEKLAEPPVPPRRPALAAAPAVAPPAARPAPRPAPVAPARDPSEWAPINSVPVAPLE